MTHHVKPIQHRRVSIMVDTNWLRSEHELLDAVDQVAARLAEIEQSATARLRNIDTLRTTCDLDDYTMRDYNHRAGHLQAVISRSTAMLESYEQQGGQGQR